MNLLRRISVWLLPLLILIVIVGLFTLKQLHNLETPPTKGWSRSIPLPMKHLSDQAKLFAQKQDTNTSIYGVTKKGISQVTISPSMHVLSHHLYPVQPDSEQIWANGQTFIYIKNGKLIQDTNGQKKTLDAHAEKMMPGNGKIIYTSGHSLKEASPETGETRTLDSFDLPFSELVPSANNQDFLVTLNQDKKTKVYYYEKKSGGYQKSLLHTFDEPSSRYSGFLFSATQDSVHLLFAKTSYSSGISTTYYTANLSKTSIEAGTPVWSPKHFDVYTADTHEPIQEIKDLSYSVIDGKDVLAFASGGSLSFHHDGQVIYTAVLNNTVALATRHSTNDLSIQPKKINASLIIWLGYQKNNNYQLYAATSNEAAIAESVKATQHDIGQAISNALILLSVNFFAIFFALIYALFAIVYYFICYFAKASAVENGARFVRWGTYLVFFISQIIFLYDFLVPKLLPSSLPVYLDFPGSPYIFAVITAIVAGLITRFVKTEYWEMFAEIIYFIIIDTLFIVLLFGGYTI